MNRRILILLLVLLMAPLALAQKKASTAYRKSEPRKERLAVDVKGFVHDQKSLSGGNWKIEKVQGEDGMWRARLDVDGVAMKEFAKCGGKEDWLRFLVWPPGPSFVAPSTPSLLFVLRYTGGAHGCEHLDIINLKDHFKTLFETDDSFNFQRIEDLDDDGWPEVIGMCRSFQDLLDLSYADCPFPTLVISYDRESEGYLCQTHRFPKEIEKTVLRFKEAFELNKAVDAKVPFDPANLRVHQGQFAPLLRWVLETCYTGEPDAAWKLLGDYATADAAQRARETIEGVLATERYYQEMMRLKSRPRS